MSDLGDVLEVMLSSGERFQTLQASIREWRDPALDEESRDQLRAREGQKAPFPRLRPRPKPFETHIRLW